MPNMKRAALILFVFNRLDHTQLTLEALTKNDFAKETDFYIFCDGPRNEKEKEKTDAVRNLVDGYADKDFFKSVSVVKSDVNKGLANSVIDGVTKVFEKHDRVIVIEDDLIASEDFLSYMNEALEFYKGTNAGSVTGYNPLKIDPNKFKKRSYATIRSCSFGWGTWKSVWQDIDWDLKDYNKYVVQTNYAKPLIVSEWGIPAANTSGELTKEEFQEKISTIMKPHGEDIQENSSFVAGGQYFEWNDEWWKGNNPTPWIHNKPTSDEWPNEWWGLHGIAPNGRTAKEGPWDVAKNAPYPADLLTARPTLAALKELYGS